jgi:hypothetical protein
MCRTTFAGWRCIAIAAIAALSAGCAGSDGSDRERASATLTDVRVRTPLVDDDGWPMPADPPPVSTAKPAGAVQAATK